MKKYIFLLLIFVCGLFVVGPYLSSQLMLPRTEELQYSIYPLMAWISDLVAGNILYWYKNAGLGVPWPIPHTMSHTPASIFLSFLPAYKSVAITVLIHVVLQGYFIVKICSHYNLKFLTTCIVIVTIILGSPVEYNIPSDAAEVFIGWTLLPGIFYSIIKIVDADSNNRKWIFSFLLAFIVGYGILNTHLGVFSTYLISASFFYCCNLSRFKKNFKFFASAMLLGILIGSEKLVFLASELHYFPADITRYQYSYHGSLYYTIWNLFLKPFNPFIFQPAGQYIDSLISMNSQSRVLTFSSPIVAPVILFGIFKCYKNPVLLIKFCSIKNVFFTVIFCLLSQYVPASVLPKAISASWTFRDPTILLAIVLAGLLYEEYIQKVVSLYLKIFLVTIHLICVVSSAFFCIYGPNFLHGQLATSVAEVENLTNLKKTHLLDSYLADALSCGESLNGCKIEQFRIASDAYTLSLANDGNAVRAGLHLNRMPLFGLNDISYLAKGVSLDAIHPSQSLPYGLIATNRYKDFKYNESGYDWVHDAPDLLQLLGINAIIATYDQKIINYGFSVVGNFDGIIDHGKSKKIYVYKNPNVFPRAFFVSDKSLSSVRVKDECAFGSKYLTCIDFSDLVDFTKPMLNQVRTTDIINGYILNFEPRAYSRKLLVTSMYRPEWRVDEGSLNEFHGITLLDVPAYTNEITLTYTPVRIYVARMVTVAATLFSLLAFAVYFVRHSRWFHRYHRNS